MLRRSFLTSASVTGAFALQSTILPSSGFANDSEAWQNWRGPNRDGMLAGQTWPDSLDENSLKSVWVKDLGDSYSGPVLTETSVFTTESIGGKERVYSFDRSNGDLQWKYEWDGSHSVPFFAARNGSWRCWWRRRLSSAPTSRPARQRYRTSSAHWPTLSSYWTKQGKTDQTRVVNKSIPSLTSKFN